MCCKTKTKKPFYSETDIEVYKVFRKVSHFRKPTFYTGPYRMEYVYEDVYDCEYTCDEFGKEVESGMIGFHSFKNFNDAVKLLDMFEVWASDDESFEIIPCVIKKGTLCYEGYYIGGEEIYVSEKITVKY